MVITLEGLKKLAEMPKSERPEGWEELVLNYLCKKEARIEQLKKMLNLVEREYEEALELAHKLGVLWVRK